MTTALGGSGNVSSGGTLSGGTTSDPGGNTATGGMPAECTSGARRCAPMGTAAQVCSAQGTWMETPCEFVCVGDACGGVCEPGSRSCDGAEPRRCTDTGTWQNDGGPCNAQCEAGVCTGACKNDTKQCQSSVNVQTCTNGQWGAPTPCENACVNQSCGGSCRPKANQCVGAREIETCSEMGTWTNRRTCDSVCANNACTGVCVPDTQRCQGDQQQRCNASGQWEKVRDCPFVCANNACTGSCDPGAKRCSGKQAQRCNNSGQWEKVEDCKFVCNVDKCDGECTPDATRCESLKSMERCGNDGFWTAGTCRGPCMNNQCNKDARFAFVTKQRFTGNLGGLGGANRKCQAAADAAGLPGQYAAFLSGDQEEDWVIERFNLQGGPIIMVDGTVLADDWADLLNGPKVPLNKTEDGGSPLNATIRPTGTEVCSGRRTLVWSNTNSQGRLSINSHSCESWTESDYKGAIFGSFAHTGRDFSEACMTVITGGNYCESEAAIYCFQQ